MVSIEMSAHHGKTRSALIAENEALRREVEVLRRSQAGKQVDQLRKAMRQAEAAATAKTRFLANMSHELRTPMTAILSCTELLIDQGEIERAVERLELLRALWRNGKHLTRIVTDILDLAKIEAGKLEVGTEPVALAETLQDLEQVMGTIAREKGLAFELTLAGSLPRTVDTDPIRARQILMNLLGNAIKFTECGGVHLHVELLRRETRSQLRFAISDTGCGMSPATLAEIFEPFSQGDSSMTRPAGGTGLGLPISRELARLLGGDLTAETIEGQGSVFLLTLPIAGIKEEDLVEPEELLASPSLCDEEDESTQQLIERVRRGGTNARILLVEDGPDNRNLLGQILRKAGFQVTLVENGQTGVQTALDHAAAGTAFDLVLMDMQMPIMDGYEAARTLRRQEMNVPIVALTAHAMAGERERCMAAGCDDFATKPIERRTLIEVVLRNLGRGRTHPR